MSDSVTNVEIEDVLSSIRRLVSENARPKHDISAPAAPRPKEPEATAVSVDKLVLGPALRVEDGEAGEEKAMEAPVVEDVPALEDEYLADESDGSGPRVLTLSSKLPSFLTEEHAAREVESDLAALAEVQAGEAQGAEEDAVFDHQPVEHSVETEFKAAEVTEHTQEKASEYPPDTDNAQDEAAELEAELDGSEHASSEPEAATNEDWVHAAEVEEDAMPEATYYAADDVIDAEADTNDKAQDAQAVYDAVLDEEMLRELVGEIVRQELQGPLGERITRNVRKLVRREINRALAGRNFE